MYARSFPLTGYTTVTIWPPMIAKREHGKGNAPTVTVLIQGPDGTLEQVAADVREGSNRGDVLAAASAAMATDLEGEIRIV
jgi:hypothetical protein